MFQAKFKEIVSQCKGMVGVALMGEDGIPVDQYIDPEEGLFEELSIELSELAGRMKEVLILREERLKESIVMTDCHIFIINQVTDYYSLIVALDPTGNFGKARFLIRKNQGWLQKEIGV